MSTTDSLLPAYVNNKDKILDTFEKSVSRVFALSGYCSYRQISSCYPCIFSKRYPHTFIQIAIAAYIQHSSHTLRLLLPTLAFTSFKARSLLSTTFTTLCTSTGRLLAFILDTHFLVSFRLGTHGDIVVPLLDGCGLTLLDVLLPLDPVPLVLVMTIQSNNVPVLARLGLCLFQPLDCLFQRLFLIGNLSTSSPLFSFSPSFPLLDLFSLLLGQTGEFRIMLFEMCQCLRWVRDMLQGCFTLF